MDSSNNTLPAQRSKWIAAIPLVVFLVLAAIFYKQLASGGGKSEIPSVLIGKQAPVFTLEPLEGLKAAAKPVPGFSSELFKDKVTIVNVWASWCVPCRQEHPVIATLADDERIQLVGLNYKDKTDNALRFLGQLGNPYKFVGTDPKGKAAIDWGVYGIPETFVVSRGGVIVHKQIGPLSEAKLKATFLPAIEKALAE